MKDTFYKVDEKARFTFPCRIKRVTGGHGGEALLIDGSEKKALYDCGMAYCGKETVSKLREVTDRLDYILLSHSHYDHIGGLPHIIEAFPEVVVLGSEKCSRILASSSARKLMKELGLAARNLYNPESDEPVPVESLRVDRIIGDGDEIKLGDYTVRVYETKGHTDCSLSFLIEPVGMLMASESTGILEGEDYVHTPVLKGFPEALESAEKCRNIHPEHICLPHFGMLPERYINDYFNRFIEECHNKKQFVEELLLFGYDEKTILDKYCEKYWTPAKEEEQPYEAFRINSEHIVKCLIKWEG